MQPSETTHTAKSAPPAYVIRYIQSFGAAVEAGRLLQARFLRWYYVVFGTGLVVGALIALTRLPIGIGVIFFCAMMLLTTQFAVMDRLFGRRQVRSVLDRPIELTLGDDGIHWDGPTGTAHFPWAAITEVRANSRTVIFVRDRLLVAYAPADAFGSSDDRAGAIAYSRRQIADAVPERVAISSK
jgi:hypothetical protein